MDLYKYLLTEEICDNATVSKGEAPAPRSDSADTSGPRVARQDSPNVVTRFSSFVAHIFPTRITAEVVVPDKQMDEEPVTPQREDPLCAVDVLPVTSQHTSEESSVDKVAPPPVHTAALLPTTQPKHESHTNRMYISMDGLLHPTRQQAPQATIAPSTPTTGVVVAGAKSSGTKNMDGVANGINAKLDFRDERMVRLAETRVSVPPSQRATAKKPSTGSYVVTLRPKQTSK